MTYCTSREVSASAYLQSQGLLIWWVETTTRSAQRGLSKTEAETKFIARNQTSFSLIRNRPARWSPDQYDGSCQDTMAFASYADYVR